jgi:hypothetical protein
MANDCQQTPAGCRTGVIVLLRDHEINILTYDETVIIVRLGQKRNAGIRLQGCPQVKVTPC